MQARASVVALGIMSGTSMDGVDYALCRVGIDSVCLLRHWHVRFPPRLQHRLQLAADGSVTAHELAQLHHDLGRFYARHAPLKKCRPRPGVIGMHGQTIFHQPRGRRPATFQLGEPAYLVETGRIPVVSNFRSSDLAGGGQGAPLATLYHRIAFGRPGRVVCVNNLGGISNVTAIDWRRRANPRVLAFDTGPANVLLDLAMLHISDGRKRQDTGGRIAARGRVQSDVLQDWLRHPYFRLRPPKSTGRELFGQRFLDRTRADLGSAASADLLATLTEFTAASLAMNYRLHLPVLPDEVILAGGGAANDTLLRRIIEHLRQAQPALRVLTVDELGWPIQSVEPAAFALLAAFRLWGHPGNLPTTTGCRRSALLGQVAEP